jgi:hypothetical protein
MALTVNCTIPIINKFSHVHQWLPCLTRIIKDLLKVYGLEGQDFNGNMLSKK